MKIKQNIQTSKTLRKYLNGVVFVFIDAANIFYSQKTLGWKLKFEYLYNYFEKNSNLGNIYFYYSQNESYPSQQRFFKKLKELGYILRIKPLKIIKDLSGTTIHKGNLDVELAIDVMKTLPQFDTMVLMSGDSDFEIVASEARKSDKRVIVMSTRGHISRELITVATKYFDLRKFKKEFSFPQSKTDIDNNKKSGAKPKPNS